jgi:uncharacterized protein (DUF983 family)
MSAGARVGRSLSRGLRLRCPRCGRTPLYARFFTMHQGCDACGFRYEREQGYFVGAIYVNYAVTTVISVGTVLLLDWSIGLTLTQQLIVGVSLSLLVPVVFFRYARSLWLSLDFMLTSADQRADRRRWR